MKPTLTALNYVRDERRAQDRKWGWPQDKTPQDWLAVLVEEVGEVAHAINEEDHDNLIEELIQVAAVAVAAVEELA